MTTNTSPVRNAIHAIATPRMIVALSRMCNLISGHREADWCPVQDPAGHASPEGTFGKGSERDAHGKIPRRCAEFRRGGNYSPPVRHLSWSAT